MDLEGLYDKAKAAGWTGVSMKTNWKRIVAFDS
jgi:hypothetical protein